MKKVWSFGDSFARGVCDGKWIKTYAEYFKEANGFETFESVSQPGASMLDIAGFINNKLTEIEEDDFVIVINTTPNRFPYPTVIKPTDKPYALNAIIDEEKSKLEHFPWIDNANPGLEHHDNIKKKLPYKFKYFFNFYIEIIKNEIASEGYSNYFKWHLDSSIKNIKTRTRNVMVLDCSLWSMKTLESLVSNSIQVKCRCKHWNQNGHKLLSKIIKWSVDNNIYYLDDNLFETMDSDLKKDLIDKLKIRNDLIQ